MHRLLVATGAAVVLAASTFSAFAAEVTGTITSVDPKTNSIQLDDGMTYMLHDYMNAGPILVGERVAVVYDQQDGQRNATTLTVIG